MSLRNNTLKKWVSGAIDPTLGAKVDDYQGVSCVVVSATHYEQLPDKSWRKVDGVLLTLLPAGDKSVYLNRVLRGRVQVQEPGMYSVITRTYNVEAQAAEIARLLGHRGIDVKIH